MGGSSAQIISLVVGFFTGLSAGATVIISQHFGAKNREELQKALHTAYAFSLAGGLAAGVLGILATPSVLRLMNTPKELMKDSITYVCIYFAGLLFIFIYNMGSAILRAIGDSKRPLYYLITCCVINIVLDLLFVLVFRMGVTGVAVATLLAQAVSAALVTWALLFRTEGLQLKPREIKIHRDILAGMLKIGLPTGIQACMYSISNIIVQTSLNAFGVDTMAAWAAFGKIDSIFWMINSAFGIAATTFVGQNFGAGKWERVRKGTRECLCMALFTAAVLSVGLMAAGRFLFGIFSSDAGVVEIGLRMMRIISPAYVLFVFIEIYSGALRAQGYVMVTTILTLVGICLLRIAWVTLLVPDGTLEQIVACYPVTWIISAAGMIAYYHYKQKKIFKYFNAA